MKANVDYKKFPIETGDIFALGDNTYLVALRHQEEIVDDYGQLPESWVVGIGFRAYGFGYYHIKKLAKGHVTWINGPADENIVVPTEQYFSVLAEILQGKERIGHDVDGADTVCCRIAGLIDGEQIDREDWTHDQDYIPEDLEEALCDGYVSPFACLKDDIEKMEGRMMGKDPNVFFRQQLRGFSVVSVFAFFDYDQVDIDTMDL